MQPSYGLIFDVDGVIADTEAVNARASIQVFADLFGLRGVRREDFEAGLGRGATAYIRAAAEQHSFEMTAEQVAAATVARQNIFLQMLAADPLPAFPGVLKLMSAALDSDAFRVAIATSSTRLKSEAVLKSAGVPYRRMVYVDGDDVTRKKPDPELFLIASEQIGIPPGRCVVIEDAPNGVQAARAAGCACIAVANSTTAAKLSQADRVVSALTQIGLQDLVAAIERRSF
jgi:HAD superfamily hydrolase (TIGR01509 family)